MNSYNHICYCGNMVPVTSASLCITSASRYHPHYQKRASMYICGLIPRYFPELAEAVPIGCIFKSSNKLTNFFKLFSHLEQYQTNLGSFTSCSTTGGL